MYRLLKSMILTGLSEPLTKALQKVARKLPATVPIIRQHILVPVLAALPVSVEEPEGAQHGAKGGAGATRHGPRDGHTNGGVVNLRGMPHTVTTFRVRHDLLSPNVVEFGKLVQQQVRWHGVNWRLRSDTGAHGLRAGRTRLQPALRAVASMFCVLR